MKMLFAAMHESPLGPEAQCQPRLQMSGCWGRPELPAHRQNGANDPERTFMRVDANTTPKPLRR